MAKSKEELIYDIENELVDPTTNKITGERVKARLLDMVDAMGTGGGGAMEYWSVPEGVSEYMEIVATLVPWVKVKVSDYTFIASSLAASSNETLAFAVDPAANLVVGPELSGTFYEILPQIGLSNPADVGCVQITKEEFYSVS